jgi:hypothetical protein
MNDLATDTTRVLRLNYPDSPHLPRLTALLEGKEKSSFSIFGLSS